MSDPAHPEPVTLVGLSDEVQAQLVIDALAAEGIKAMSVGGETAAMRDVVPGEVRVLVADTDLPRARKVLEDFLNDQATDVDWEHTDLDRPQ